MTVEELIKELKKLDPTSEVVLQGDEEGNFFKRLTGVDPEGIIVQFDATDFEVYDARWTADDADMTEEEWNAYLTLPRCVVLYP